VRLNDNCQVLLEFVSIHAPARGATYLLMCVFYHHAVSSNLQCTKNGK